MNLPLARRFHLGTLRLSRAELRGLREEWAHVESPPLRAMKRRDDGGALADAGDEPSPSLRRHFFAACRARRNEPAAGEWSGR